MISRTESIFSLCILILLGLVILIQRQLSKTQKVLRERIQLFTDSTNKVLINTYIDHTQLNNLTHLEKAELDKNLATIKIKNNMNITQKILLLSTLCKQFNFDITKIFTSEGNVSIYINDKSKYIIIVLENNKVIIGGNDFDILVDIRKMILEYKSS